MLLIPCAMPFSCVLHEIAAPFTVREPLFFTAQNNNSEEEVPLTVTLPVPALSSMVSEPSLVSAHSFEAVSVCPFKSMVTCLFAATVTDSV